MFPIWSAFDIVKNFLNKDWCKILYWKHFRMTQTNQKSLFHNFLSKRSWLRLGWELTWERDNEETIQKLEKRVPAKSGNQNQVVEWCDTISKKDVFWLFWRGPEWSDHVENKCWKILPMSRFKPRLVASSTVPQPLPQKLAFKIHVPMIHIDHTSKTLFQNVKFYQIKWLVIFIQYQLQT